MLQQFKITFYAIILCLFGLTLPVSPVLAENCAVLKQTDAMDREALYEAANCYRDRAKSLQAAYQNEKQQRITHSLPVASSDSDKAELACHVAITLASQVALLHTDMEVQIFGIALGVCNKVIGGRSIGCVPRLQSALQTACHISFGPIS